jgi:hypothetical protein
VRPVERVASNTVRGRVVLWWRGSGLALLLIGTPLAAWFFGIDGFIACGVGGCLLLEACPRADVYDPEWEKP